MGMNVTQIGLTSKASTVKKAETAQTKNASIENQKEVVSQAGSDAVKSAAMAGIKLHRTMTVQRNGEDYKIEGKYRVIGETTTEEANKFWASKGYDSEPYKNGQKAQIIELTEPAKFVRTYDGKNSFKAGGWVMKYDDIKGLTPEEIADKYALPQVPKYMCDAEFPAGTKLRTGECNPLFGFKGGGQQFDLMGARAGEFKNEREIGVAAK